MSLTIVNAVIAPVVNLVILFLKPKILYTKTTCSLSSVVFLSRRGKTEKLNVVNYKHETHALAFTFKAVSWQI